MPDTFTLVIAGREYGGWTRARATRGIDRAAADFDIEVSERWIAPGRPWQIRPFDTGQLYIGDDLALTGYVDAYEPEIAGPATHRVRIAGRSKTEDLIDCMPEITGGQYNDWKLDQIARAVAQPFGITVKVETDVGDPFPDATLQRCETAFQFLERLCRLRGVLACDDETGALVLTTAGPTSAAGALVEGQNILEARGRLNVAKRFSKYIVRSQHGLWEESDDVQIDVVGEATDGSCPRYRPFISMAETALDDAGAQERARWQAVYHAARGIAADITVEGFRQVDERLWRINQRIPVRSPRLQLDRVMLIARTGYEQDLQRGSRTVLTVGPVEAYTPDPGQVKLKKGHGTAATWNDVQSIK